MCQGPGFLPPPPPPMVWFGFQSWKSPRKGQDLSQKLYPVGAGGCHPLGVGGHQGFVWISVKNV